MLLQAHSIEKFVVAPIVHHVYVQDDRIPLYLWEKALSPIYKNHKLVLSYNKFKIYDGVDKAHGWNEQQYIKLMLASEMQEEYILSLDSKNVFCTQVNIDKVFHGYEGTMGTDVDVYTSNLEWVKYWSPWINLIENFTGLRSPLQKFPCTPFVFKKSSLRKMNQYLNVKNLFQEVSKKEIRPSEYILYNFFKDNKSLSLNGNPESFGIFTIFRRDLDDVEGYKENTRNYLLSLGLESRYVNPAIDMTTHKNR
jgi:hypothetical protein